MKIETFQKIQNKLIDLLLLPVTIFITIAIYSWTSFWNSYFYIAFTIFLGSLVFCIYFITINLIEKPFTYLYQTYKDNKKYKTLRKLSLKEQTVKIQENQKKQVQNGFAVQLQKDIFKNLTQLKPIHLSFNVEQQKKSSQEKIKMSPVTIPRRDLQSIAGNFLSKNQAPSNYIDILDIFSTSEKSKPSKQKIMQRGPSQQIQQSEEFIQESKKLKNHLQKITKFQDIDTLIKEEYQKRYNQYKQTLIKFNFDQQNIKENIENSIYETKQIVKQKIQQNLKYQFQNLDKIENLLKNNFNVNFKSYKERSSSADKGSNNIYEQSFSHSLGQWRTKKQEFFVQNIGQRNQSSSKMFKNKLKFSQVLQQCTNLLQTNFFDYEFIGQAENYNQIKNQLKKLIMQRMELDNFFLLKQPLINAKQSHIKQERKHQYACQFEEQRFLNILKLQNLAFILSQRQNSQQNLLKDFFSNPHNISNNAQLTEQINDQKNITLLMKFMIKTFQTKINQSGNSEQIKIQLPKPNFKEKTSNVIWVKKQNSLQNHYNIRYSLKNGTKPKQKIQQGQSKQIKALPDEEELCCCPGQKNIWICFFFIRVLISRIGLKAPQYPMIKNNQLRKDLRKLVQLLK